MGHTRHAIIFLSIIIAACFCYSNACHIDGTNLGHTYEAWIQDYHEGIFWQNRTTGVGGINYFTIGGVIRNEEYLGVDFADSQIELFTTEFFKEYEEYEVSHFIDLHMKYDCAQVWDYQMIRVHIRDTNNHPPTFIYEDNLDEFIINIAAPLAPGYEVTSRASVTVRDVDLTTDKIIFRIQENAYFEIEEEILRNDNTPKQFQAIIRTKTFIRSFPERLSLTIWATDSDLTEGPPRTKTATVTFLSDSDFVLPDEPVFSETFYLADYIYDTDKYRVVLTEPISLRSGYDQLVQFNIRGEYSENFELVESDKENERSIGVIRPLAGDDLRKNNIHLIVTADREYTSGASATVVLRLPEVAPLEFQSAHYRGKIKDNILDAPPLILRQGYEDGPVSVTVTVTNGHSSGFTGNLLGNTVTLEMTPLEESLILENGFLNLEVLATNSHSTATTIVTLEIIKDDNVTPVFSKPIYMGSYSPANLILDQIELVQGYDEIDAVELFGEDKKYFRPQLNGAIVTIETVKSIPPEIYLKERLVMSLEVRKLRTVGASATIIINLPTVAPLEFQSAHYRGTIENNILDAPPLILRQGYEDGPVSVTVTVTNGHSSGFTGNLLGNTVTLEMTPLEESLILENRFLNLEVLATNSHSTATTIVTLEIIKDDNVTPVFSKPIYMGSYSPANLILDQIELVQGYDEIDAVELFGEDKRFFRPQLNGAIVTIETVGSIPPEIYSKERLVMSLEVRKLRTVGASATIIINLPTARELKFEASTVRGSLQNNKLNLDPIRLTVGYDDSVVFTITGEFADYFRVTNGQNPAIINLDRDIPSADILKNNFIFLTLVASGLNAVTTTSSVLLDIIKEDTTTPVFSRNIYYGTYSSITNFNLEVINLVQGLGDGVTISLDGENARFFDYSINGVDIEVFPRSTIPEDLIFKEKVLVFNILATKALTVGASAAISITFPADLTDRVILQFEQSTYTGTLGSNGLSVDKIVLSSGYEPGTEFILTGDHSEEFKLEDNKNVVTLTLPGSLPDEATENAFIVLEIEARRTRAIPVWTSVVIEVIREGIDPLVFEQAYYRGAYHAESGLQFNQVISLSQGYHESVVFDLEGEWKPLFVLTPGSDGSVTITAPRSIPNDVIQANSQLLFAVVATRPGALAARSAVSIDIEKDLTDRVILQFEQSTYTGTLGSNGLSVDKIVLSSGYEPGTEFILTGDHSEEFKLEDNKNVVTLTLPGSLPDEATENAFIVLEIEARRTRAIPVWTSVVIEVIREGIDPLVFEQAYYRGAYHAESGLQFNQVISLSQGYHESVVFDLEGEWKPLFVLTPGSDGSVTITAPRSIPNDVIQSNSQLLFAVVATRPGALAARSAVSIDIEKDLTDRVILQFEQSTYTGTLGSNGLSVDKIVLSSGYEPGTEFILTGDHSEEFKLEDNKNVVTLTLPGSLPDEATENAFIVLEIEARRTRAIPVWTSVVIEVIREGIDPLVFEQAYYRGAYHAESGLQFNQVISLSQGYHESVVFDLEGEWKPLFVLTPGSDGSVTITAPRSIPNDVIQANSQLLFAVVATRPGALAARSAVSIDIEKDLTDRVILQFEQSTYTGTLGSNGLSVDKIVLSSGYEPGTEFILTGDHSEEFKLEDNKNVVTLTLPGSLPDEATENAFIVLEIEARRTRAIPVWTSVVIEVIREGIDPLVFEQAYYRGAYHAESGLQFNQVISLSQGYHESVVFDLEGEWKPLFVLTPGSDGSVTITAPRSIPNDVIQANSQLLFAVVATRPGALAARSAVSIDIEKDLTDRVILQFEQSTYTGTLGSNGLSVDKIVLSSGYEPGTEFILTGDHSEEFKLEDNKNVVTLTLPGSLPDEATENAFIVLEIEARRTRAIPVWTSVVIEVIREGIDPLVFEQAYYRGAYHAESGLQFNQVISLSQGYHESVVFDLEGEWKPLFVLTPGSDGSVTITAPRSIPNDVIQANSQLLFAVVATRPGALAARSAVSIDIEKDLTDRVILQFEQSTYTGTLGSNGLSVDKIVLSSGYEPGTEFILTGDHSEEFKLEDNKNVVTLTLPGSLPDEATENAFIVLEIEARRTRAIPVWTSVVIEVIREGIDPLVFEQAYYRGAYHAESGLQFNQVISLSQGYHESVVFDLEGEWKPLFVLTPGSDGSVTITAPRSIPNDVIQANSQLLFAVVATRPGALAARSAVSIDIEKDLTDRVILQFEQSTYTGTLGSNGLSVDKIVLSSGYEPGTEFILTGDHSEEFKLEDNKNVVTLTLPGSLPDEATENAFIVLEIEARRTRAIPVWTSVVIEVIREGIDPLVFEQAYYRGAYHAESGLQFNQVISLSQGYHESVVFDLEGEWKPLFVLTPGSDGSVTITAPRSIPNDVIQANSQLLFAVVATRPGALAARSAVSIDIEKDLTDRVILQFEQSTYTGTLGSNGLSVDKIVLSSGYEPGTEFILTGDHSEEFKLEDNKNVVTLTLPGSLPDEATENAFIVLEIEARRTRAIPVWTSVVIEVIREGIDPLVFEQAYYRGAYHAESGLQFNQVISLSQGYHESVVFDLEGEWKPLFVLTPGSDGSVTITAPWSIPNDVIQANSQLLFAVVATRPGALAARSAVSIDIEKDSLAGEDASFGHALYRGVIDLNEVRHDSITITGYDGATVEIIGEYSTMFESSISGGGVTVQATEGLNLPAEVTHVALELYAARARTVLLLKVLEPDTSLVPSVTFSSESYLLSVDVAQIGFVSRISASADNGDEVTYSLRTDDAHLQSRLSINNQGDLYLSEPANSGVYSFQVIATTVLSHATGTATVHLIVQADTVCEDNLIPMPPLVTLERDEEEPHSNLVELDSTQHAGCYFSLTNRWPLDQTWLYVDEFGLHTRAIDREHASIAFMALSQVQVELELHCRSDTDSTIRKKRETTARLGPYDYGSKKWILTDSIPYDSRRSLVNLIVNDINDNDPIFVGKEHEPIAVGYPTAELEERILPRSLAELQATDADIGINAAIRYSSTDSVLAVAPTTGFVHVRTGARLTHDQTLIVIATDENGRGRSGTIELIVKLLDFNHIAVVTIRDAFLDDETTVLARLSDAVGYDVKALRSVVTSGDGTRAGTTGAVLQLYVYGIDERQPVTVDRLVTDVSANAAIVSVASTIPLEDHLQDMNIVDRQIALLVTTIIFSVLFFAVVVLVAIWFFLRWRKNKKYNEFSDENSIASRNASLGELPKPEPEKPRLNIEELKRSEKRLQEMLQTPIETVTVEPMPKKTETPVEAILDLPIIEPSAPIVIQSIDKLKDAEDSSDDEFGEVSAKPRKSVVTFNENVEKIIHVEDNADDDGDNDDGDDDLNSNPNVDASNSGYEIYRL